jgi:hypothetical protein
MNDLMAAGLSNLQRETIPSNPELLMSPIINVRNAMMWRHVMIVMNDYRV